MLKFNSFHSFKPYLVLAKVFGLFPYNISKKNSKIILKLNKIWYLPSTFVIAILLYTIVKISIYGKAKATTIELWRIISLTSSMLSLIQFIYLLFQEERKINLIEKIQRLDEKSLRIGIFVSNKDQKKINIAIIILLIIITLNSAMVFIPFLIFYTKSDIFLVFCTSLSTSQILEIFYGFQFNYFAWLLKIRFLNLTEFLDFSLKIKRIGWRNEKIKQFSELFNMTCSAIETFNQIFSNNMIFTFLYFIIYEIFTLEATIDFFYSDSRGHTFISIICNIVSTIILLMVRISICWSGHSLQSSVDKSENHIIKHILEFQDEVFELELRKLHYKLNNLHKSVENVFFKINMGLFLTVS